MIVSRHKSVLMPLLLLSLDCLVSADDGEKDAVKSDHNEEPFIIPSFFNFYKENIFQPREEETDYVLEAGVSLERDYDFYSDVEASESAPLTVRAGYSGRLAQSRQDYDDYDYYDDQPSSRDYGHSSYSSGSSGGGGHGHGSYGGYKVQPKKPGPYGYPSPNFKCEKASETLYVTETEMTYDKKCYNVYKVGPTLKYHRVIISFIITTFRSNVRTVMTRGRLGHP